jgi:hypothetical protein
VSARLLLFVLALACGASWAGADKAFVVVRPEPMEDPWWLRAELNPRAKFVRGIAIQRLQPAWCTAQAFAPNLFGDELLGPAGGEPFAGGLSFDLDAALDGTGRLQNAFVGAYRRCDGERGLFLAIVDLSREGIKERSKLRFLVEVPDAGSAFAAVGLEPDGTLAVWWCAQCDTGHRILYNKETRGFYVSGPASRRLQ